MSRLLGSAKRYWNAGSQEFRVSANLDPKNNPRRLRVNGMTGFEPATPCSRKLSMEGENPESKQPI